MHALDQGNRLEDCLGPAVFDPGGFPLMLPLGQVSEGPHVVHAMQLTLGIDVDHLKYQFERTTPQ